MAPEFSRTFRSLQEDGPRRASIALGLALAILAVWALWLVIARVSLYEVSETGRLEMERVYPVAAPVTGKVVATHLALAREVQAGEVLVEIESERENLEAAEERARLAGFERQLEAIGREIEAEERALVENGRAAGSAVSEAQQRLVAARAAARQAEDQAQRVNRLQKQGLVAQAEAVKARAEAEARRAEAGAARVAVERVGAEQQAGERTREAKIASLNRDRSEGLDGQREMLRSLVTRREREAERRRIRAPMAGRLGEVAVLQVGAVVREGERLASVVPDGQVRVGADFPVTALGRVRTGQAARIRLDGFPWLQYGRLPATVTRVASEGARAAGPRRASPWAARPTCP